jgi:hypothetical protein
LSVSDYPLTVTVTFASTLYVGNTLKPSVSFTTPISVILSTDTFNFIVDSSSTAYLSIISTSSGSGNNFFIGSTLVNTIQLSAINITNGVTFPSVSNASNTDTFSAGSNLINSGGYNIKSLVNSGTKTVFLQIFRNKNSYASGKATITVSPNWLISATITALSYTVSALTTYTFSVTVRNPLTTGGGMRITLPAELFIAIGACTAAVSSSYGGAISTNNSCVASSNTVIFITNMFSANFPGNNAVSVAISNIQNPISAKQSGTFSFETFYSSSELTNPVDDSSTLTGLTVTATAGTITAGNFAVFRNIVTNM